MTIQPRICACVSAFILQAEQPFYAECADITGGDPSPPGYAEVGEFRVFLQSLKISEKVYATCRENEVADPVSSCMFQLMFSCTRRLRLPFRWGIPACPW